MEVDLDYFTNSQPLSLHARPRTISTSSLDKVVSKVVGKKSRKMDFDDSSVLPEFGNSLSDFSVLSSIKKVVENLEKSFFLLVTHSFSEFFNLVDLSPSLETISNISAQVLEELKKSFFLDSIIFVVSEGNVTD